MKKSITGYKKNSKDRKEPVLEIPGGNITMKDVPHDVLAITDDGTVHLMKPNNNYIFDTKSVIEIPIKQKGGIMKKNNISNFEKYLNSLPSRGQDELLDYIDTLSEEDQQKFLHGGIATWKKYQKGGTTKVTQRDFETKGENLNTDNYPKGVHNSGRGLLSKGSKGEEVTMLQDFLKSKGFYVGEIDGIYGKLTERAVRDYQKWFNKNSKYPLMYQTDNGTKLIGAKQGKISEDGIVGDQTRAALMYREIPKDKQVPIKEPIYNHPVGETTLQYTTTDTNPDSPGPDGMNYAVGAGLAALAGLPFLMEAVPSASGEGAIKSLIRERLKGSGNLMREVPNSLGKGPGNPGARAFQPKTPSSYGTRIHYQDGGLIPVETEGDETVQLPNGNLYEFNGPKHSQGGIDTMLPEGSKIFSEYLKADPNVASIILGKKTKKKMSWADLSKKFDTTKYDKVLNNPDSDKYELETARLKSLNNEAILNTIFQAQEESKMSNNNKEYQKGGTVTSELYPGSLEGASTSGFNLSKYSDRFKKTRFDNVFYDPKHETYFFRNKEGLYKEHFKRGHNPEYDYVPSEKQQPNIDVNGKSKPTIDYGNFYPDPNYIVTGQMFTPRFDEKPTGAFFDLSKKDFPDGANTYDDYNNVIEQIEPIQRPKGKPVSTTSKKATPKPVPTRQPFPNFDQLEGLGLPDNVTSERSGPPDISGSIPNTDNQVTTPEEEAKKKWRFKFDGISPKLAGTIMDIGLAMSDKLNVRNPQFRDLRKYPLFTRFVDFDDKEAGRNLALNIQQIQNSNMPEEVKQARIANLQAQYQDYTAKVDFGNAQRYQAKLDQDTEKLQQYINANTDQHYQDIERYNQQKARVDYLKDQFNAQRKSRVVNSIRNYLDYVDTTNMQNQLYSENYKINPFSGKIVFKGEKKDPFKEIEEQMAQYEQNPLRSRKMDKGLNWLANGKGIFVDESGKGTFIDLTK